MRPRPTLTDYVVIAISPALIMALVGSLVFFLVEVLYQGHYETRLQVVLALFVMAAVLIARISIEEGREYASMFALPLAAVTLLALFRFVEFSGPLARIGWLINIGLIGVIWWCADKLTWDCTVIDEQKDASGEGLLQTIGFEDGTASEGAADLDATSERPVAAAEPPRSWWQRFVEARRRPHAPGVWVVYFSMAALPIFGLGQAFFFQDDLGSRRFVFKLLMVYVAAALGLLLTTSFLGLRRYLRQRRLEMPAEMAGAWLGVGSVMIVALLLFCLLLPRRNAEYSITHLPALAHSPEGLRTSRFAFGNDGPEKEQAARQVARDDAQQQSQRPGDQPGDSSPSEQSSQQGGSPSGGGKSSGGKSSGSGRDSQDQSQPSPSDKQKTGASREPGNQKSSDRQQESSSQQDSRDQPSRETSQGKSPNTNDANGQRSKSSDQAQQSDGREGGKREGGGERQQQQQQQQRSRSDSRSSASSQMFRPLELLGRGVGWLLQLLYWAVVLLIVGYLLWRYWDQISRAVRNFLQALQDLWTRLFGGEPPAAAEAAPAEPAAPTLTPFASYANPFRSGLARQVPLPQLVKYSFEALEAWAREQGCGRAPEQTPHEFAQELSRQQVAISQDAVRVADLYNRSAYSNESLPPTAIGTLQKLWQHLETPHASLVGSD